MRKMLTQKRRTRLLGSTKGKIRQLKRFLREREAGTEVRVLDLGVANNSLEIMRDACKSYKLDYVGVDMPSMALDKEVIGIDLNKEGLLSYFQKEFDYIVASHILEHLDDPYKIATEAVSLLRVGGIAYFEFPNEKCLEKKRFCSYDFYGDPTHKAPLNAYKLSMKICSSRMAIIQCGRYVPSALQALGNIIHVAVRVIQNRKSKTAPLVYVCGLVDVLVVRRLG